MTRRLRRGSGSAVLMLLLMLTMSLSVFAQGGPSGTTDAATVLRRSNEAMQNVRSMRFSLTLELDGTDSLMSELGTIKMNGDVELPDRVRIGMTMAGEELGEIVVIGDEMWTRMGSGPWEATPGMFGTSGMGMPGISNPAMFGQFDDYFTGLTLREEGANYRVVAQLDFMRLMAAMLNDPSLGGGLGGSFGSGFGMGQSMTDDLGFTLDFEFVINRATRYMTALEMRFATTDGGRSAFTGAGNMLIRASFFDYDDPSVRVTAPTVVRTRPAPDFGPVIR